MTEEKDAIRLRYRGWDFEFDEMPKSDDLAARFDAHIAKTEISLPVPVPVRLRRAYGPWSATLLAEERIVLSAAGNGRLSDHARAALQNAGATILDPGADDFSTLVLDMSGAETFDALDDMQAFVQSHLPRLQQSGHLIFLTIPGEACVTAEAAAVRGAVIGYMKTLSRELGPMGSTANVVSVTAGSEESMTWPLTFLCSTRSAFVSGETVHVSGKSAVPPSEKFLSGKTAVVTGAARGIGRETAKQLAAQGANVIAIDLPGDNPYGEPDSAAKLDSLREEIGGESVLLDVASAEAPARLVEIARAHGGIDILVNNAAIVRDNMASSMRPEAWREVLRVNLRAIERLIGACLDAECVNPQGRIICIGSVAGIAGNFGQSNYSASKAGLIELTRFHVARAGAHNITFNVIATGTTQTRLLGRDVPEWMVDAGRRLNALSQVGQPIDTANAVVFFSAPQSQAITGEVLRVCGAALQGA